MGIMCVGVVRSFVFCSVKGDRCMRFVVLCVFLFVMSSILSLGGIVRWWFVWRVVFVWRGFCCMEEFVWN